MEEKTTTKILPLGVKKNMANQKYRIPFKNSSSTDADIEFTFVKTPSAQEE